MFVCHVSTAFPLFYFSLVIIIYFILFFLQASSFPPHLHCPQVTLFHPVLLPSTPAVEMLSPAWLSLLVHPRLHSSLCGLLVRTAVLLRVASRNRDALQRLCDPSSLQMSLRELCCLLAQNGVHLPPALTAAAAAETV